MSVLMLLTTIYAAYRMTQRSRSELDLEVVPYAPVAASTTTQAAEIAQEYYSDAEMDTGEDEDSVNQY